jgi:polyferredoxin
MGTDKMNLIKIHQYLEYIIIGIFVYFYFSFVFPILPGLNYSDFRGQEGGIFIVVIFVMSAILYVNSIAIRRLRAKGR